MAPFHTCLTIGPIQLFVALYLKAPFSNPRETYQAVTNRAILCATALLYNEVNKPFLRLYHDNIFCNFRGRK